MKALVGLLWGSAALVAYAIAGEALVYTSESWSRQTPAEPPSISPHAARLLFAQRLGLSQYHSLQDADESTLRILNTYGGEQQQIFAHEDGSQGAEKLLLIVEGVDEGGLRPPELMISISLTPCIRFMRPISRSCLQDRTATFKLTKPGTGY